MQEVDTLDFRFEKRPRSKTDQKRNHRYQPWKREKPPRRTQTPSVTYQHFHPDIATLRSDPTNSLRCSCSACLRDYETVELFVVNPCFCCVCAQCVAAGMQVIGEQQAWKCPTCHQFTTHLCGLLFQRTLMQSFLQNPGVLSSLKKLPGAKEYGGISKEANAALEKLDLFLQACVKEDMLP